MLDAIMLNFVNLVAELLRALPKTLVALRLLINCAVIELAVHLDALLQRGIDY